MTRFFLGLLAPCVLLATPVALDLSGVKAGPVSVTRDGDSAVVKWQDEGKRTWEAIFNLEPSRPLITAIRVDGKAVVQNASPLYNCQTGKRRGGFDEFFDFPPT